LKTEENMAPEDKALLIQLFDMYSLSYAQDAEAHETRLAWGFAPVMRPCVNTNGIIFFVTTDTIRNKRRYTLRIALINSEGHVFEFSTIGRVQIGMYDTRAKAERGYNGLTTAFTRYTYSVEKGVTMGIGIKPGETTTETAPVNPQTAKEAKPKRNWITHPPVTQEDIDELIALGKRPPGYKLEDEPRLYRPKCQFLAPKGQECAAKALVKVKQGEFTYIGEVCEYLDRLQVLEQPPELEELFKAYFLRETGKELSEFIEV
jgi:hypothetical protein